MARMTHGSRSASGGEDGIPLVDVPYATRLRPGWLPQQQQQEQLGRRADGDDDAQRSRQEASTSTSSGSTSGSTSGGTRKGSLGADSVKGPLPGGVPARPPASGRAATLGADNDDESLPLPVLNSSPSSLPPMSSTAERPPLSNKRVVRVGQRIVRFLAGPSPPQRLPYIGDSLALSVTLPHFGRLSINPDAWFARTYQAQFRRRFPPGSYRHGALLFIFLAAWLIGFAFLVRVNSFRSATEPSDGSGVTFLSCIDTFAGARDSCGLDFADCGDEGSLTFRCPAGCASQLIYNTVAVGNLQPDGVPFVIGGGQSNGTAVYRADSFICSSYVHSGLVSNSRGGCGVVNLLQNVTGFPAVLAHGIQSLPFPSIYPLAFSFAEVDSIRCQDIRWEILGFNVAMGVILSLFFDPGPLVFFWTLVCVSYWHVILISDPRAYPPVISDAFQDFIPVLLAGYFFWRTAYRFTLPSFASHVLERTVWYLGPFWCGTLLNVVTEKIQIDRLGGGNIKAVGSFVALIIVIVILAGWQISVAWRTGWLPFYLRWTVAGGLVLLVLSQLPDLVFRLHHYLFALLFTPALGFATRVSAALQGLLLGIFANGVGKYGFESILETAAELRRDAAFGSDLPVLQTNASTWPAYTGELFNEAALRWEAVPSALESDWNGFSLLVDDVERYRGTAKNYSLAGLNHTLPHFFRLAYQLDGVSGDYTRAATWWPNGTWVDPAEGPS